MCINWSEWPDMMLSMSDGLLIKFRSSPNVFIMTLVSESFSSWNIRSVPSVLMIFVLMCSSVLKHMFIKAHVPFSRSAISECCVSWHSNSMAPSSTIGSLAGENSNNKLHMVEVTTVNSSLDGLPDERAISGRHTKWSWNVVRSCCTERDSECKHRTAASRTSALGSPRPASTLSMMLSRSMIRLRISSSLAPSEAKHRNAPWRGAAAEQCNRPLNDMINWLLMAAKRCSSESIWKWRSRVSVRRSIRSDSNSYRTSAKYASVSADVALMSSSNSSVQSRARHGNVLYTIRASVGQSEPDRCMYVRQRAAAIWISGMRALDVSDASRSGMGRSS